MKCIYPCRKNFASLSWSCQEVHVSASLRYLLHSVWKYLCWRDIVQGCELTHFSFCQHRSVFHLVWGATYLFVSPSFIMTAWYENVFCVTFPLWGLGQYYVFLEVGLYELLNKQSIGRWFEAPRRSCDVTAMFDLKSMCICNSTP